MPSVEATYLADLLIEAHRAGSTFHAPPTPASVDAAMAIQGRVAAALGRSIGGWKVAINPEFGPVAAPLMDHLIRENPTSWPFTPGIAIEVEVAVQLGRDLPSQDYNRDAIVEAIESMSLGIEIVYPRLAAGAPFLSMLADNLGNAGYVIGQKRTAWKDCDPGAFDLTLTCGEKILHRGVCSYPLKDPLMPVAACAASLNKTRPGFLAGQIITTGSICGLIPVPGPGLVRAEIAPFGAVEIQFT